MPELLVKAQGLNPAQLEQIRRLAAACDAADGIAMRLNWRLWSTGRRVRSMTCCATRTVQTTTAS